MILVDTSVFIQYFRSAESEATRKLQHVLDTGLPFGINCYVYQELLQGAANESEFVRLKKYLDTQTFYHLRNGRESFADAARLYFRCRKKGITVHGMVDFLIVQTALENNLCLLHQDGDYLKIRTVVPALKFY